MSKIELTDNTASAISKMSDGNPGAITTMMQILSGYEDIDPQSMMGGVGVILLLDTFEIYGTEIYILFNDKCDRDVRSLAILLRAVQLGYLPKSKLKEMAEDQMRQINLSEEEFDELDKKVCKSLPRFKKPE